MDQSLIFILSVVAIVLALIGFVAQLRLFTISSTLLEVREELRALRSGQVATPSQAPRTDEAQTAPSQSKKNNLIGLAIVIAVLALIAIGSFALK